MPGSAVAFAADQRGDDEDDGEDGGEDDDEDESGDVRKDDDVTQPMLAQGRYKFMSCILKKERNTKQGRLLICLRSQVHSTVILALTSLP